LLSHGDAAMGGSGAVAKSAQHYYPLRHVSKVESH
jgi:hypothetical protein